MKTKDRAQYRLYKYGLWSHTELVPVQVLALSRFKKLKKLLKFPIFNSLFSKSELMMPPCKDVENPIIFLLLLLLLFWFSVFFFCPHCIENQLELFKTLNTEVCGVY